MTASPENIGRSRLGEEILEHQAEKKSRENRRE
jgi:hypothetical protein